MALKDWMLRLWKSVVTRISAHGASVVAISSLAIALCSLYLTIQAQKEDREYKELMIRPSLKYDIQTANFSIGFTNNGLGPAHVEEIVYHLGGECMSLLDESGSLSQANYYKVESAIRDRLFTELFSFSWFTEPTTFVATRSQLITPQSIMEVGKTIFLFKIDDSSLELFRKKLNELPPSISQSLRDNFAARAYNLPIDMRYCSMSGKYCFSAMHEPGEKKPCALKG